MSFENKSFSDSPSSQFKEQIYCCYPMVTMAFIKVVLGPFATSHGKGPVDGIRGMVTRTATQKVIQRKVNISTAASFYNAISRESNLKPFLIEDMEIRNII